MLRAGMGVAFFAFVAFEQNAPGGTRRGGRGCPPPNQAHQAVPTSWADGWMGLGTAADAEFDTKCQLIRSVPYLIQGVRLPAASCCQYPYPGSQCPVGPKIKAALGPLNPLP